MSLTPSLAARPWRALAAATAAAVAVVALPAALPATAAEGTTVGGVLSNDTIWNSAGSPYRVTSTVQVPSGVTLTIQPGTRVVGEGVADLFQLHGSLLAEGTPTERVDFDGGRFANFFSAKGATAAVLRLSNVVVHHGRSLWPATGHEQSGQLHVADSEFHNVEEYSYIWYPTSNSRFERNVFVDSAGFSVGTHTNAQVFFENNRFVRASRSGYWIRQWAAYGQPTVVTGNTFMIAGAPSVELQSGYDSAKMIATGNYWSTTDISIINDMIADGRDSIARAGIIEYEPFLDAPTSQTPAVPSQAPSPEPMATFSPGPTPSASPGTSTAPSNPATSTPATSPSATPPAAPTVEISPSIISAGQSVTVTYRGTPGSSVDILSRTQPSTVFTRIGGSSHLSGAS
jgi:hypothetical protein